MCCYCLPSSNQPDLHYCCSGRCLCLLLQPSVEAAVAAHPDRFVVADVKWTGGTEQMLDAVQQHFQQLEQQQLAGAVEAAPNQCS